MQELKILIICSDSFNRPIESLDLKDLSINGENFNHPIEELDFLQLTTFKLNGKEQKIESSLR